MSHRTMVRSTLAALAAVTLLAAPAAAAAPDRGAETARAGWVIDLGGLLERAWGLLFGERAVGRDEMAGDRSGRIERVSAAEEGGNSWDPDG